MSLEVQTNPKQYCPDHEEGNAVSWSGDEDVDTLDSGGGYL
jgi:hypothetical protein